MDVAAEQCVCVHACGHTRGAIAESSAVQCPSIPSHSDTASPAERVPVRLLSSSSLWPEKLQLAQAVTVGLQPDSKLPLDQLPRPDEAGGFGSGFVYFGILKCSTWTAVGMKNLRHTG